VLPRTQNRSCSRRKVCTPVALGHVPRPDGLVLAVADDEVLQQQEQPARQQQQRHSSLCAVVEARKGVKTQGLQRSTTQLWYSSGLWLACGCITGNHWALPATKA